MKCQGLLATVIHLLGGGLPASRNCDREAKYKATIYSLVQTNPEIRYESRIRYLCQYCALRYRDNHPYAWKPDWYKENIIEKVEEGK